MKCNYSVVTMKKLILVHDEKSDLMMNFAKTFTHHIRCPILVAMGLIIVGGDEYTYDDIADSFLKAADEEYTQHQHGCMFISNNGPLTTAVVEVSQRFNVFNLYNSPSEKWRDRNVVVNDEKDVGYAFTQIVQWVYD